MISILIPVFNRNITALITSLHRQLVMADVKAEIVVMDDASSDNILKNQNRIALSLLNHVRYVELPSNKGRNIIRHQLADAAAYDKLIFLDADSSFPDELWLQRYITALRQNAVIMGGRAYQTSAPGKSTLHFRYGQLREQYPAAQRNKFPCRSFLACNFSITKQQFSRLIIDEHLQGYCHEDTFMGLQFGKLGIPVLHIDNPVYHDGIDEDSVFIKKQQEALKNLRYLYHTYGSSYPFSTEIKLIRVYKKINAAIWRRWLLGKATVLKAYFLQKALQSHRIFWLDCWKLAEFHQLSAGIT